MTWKAPSFLWGLEQKKALQQVQAGVQASILELDIPMVGEVSMADMEALRYLCWYPVVVSNKRSLDIRARL